MTSAVLVVDPGYGNSSFLVEVPSSDLLVVGHGLRLRTDESK
jgi:hypothetical protein